MTTTAEAPDLGVDAPLGAVDEQPVASAQVLIETVRAERVARDAAEARILQLAVTWAEAHTVWPGQPAPPGAFGREHAEADRPEDLEWAGLPTLRWDTAASFAAALGLSTAGGKNLIRDALTLALRMPRTWRRVISGEVQGWRARRIAQAVQGYPDDVATLVDQLCAPRAHQLGPVTIDRIVDGAMLRLHAEERELAQLEALDARYARLLLETINDTGICEFTARGDVADLTALDDTLAALAQVLRDHGCEEPLDVRRSIALGVLADPTRAAGLLAQSAGVVESTPEQADRETQRATQTEPADPNTEQDPGPQSADAPGEPAREPAADALEGTVFQRYRGDANGLGVVSRRQRLFFTLHLTEANLLGLDPMTTDTTQRAVLDQTIRTWASRDDMALQVTPIRHCGGCPKCEHAAHADDPGLRTHEPSVADRAVVAQRDPTCVFPWCTRPVMACDDDHTVPFDHENPARGGPTCHHNLAPLCRHHHRLKTLAGWSYETLDPGSYLWHDPHGQTFLRTPTNTTDITSDAAPNRDSTRPATVTGWSTTRPSSAAALRTTAEVVRPTQRS